MVALVLVGVGVGELGDGLVEHIRAAEVGSDRDPVTGAGVGPGQRPAAQLPYSRMVRGVIASMPSEPFQSCSWRTQ